MISSESRNANVSLDLSRERDFEKILTLGEAISNPTRLSILKHLQTPPFIKTVPELVKELNIPTTTLMHHIDKLEKANLLEIRYKGSSTGTTRIVSRGIHGAELDLFYGGYDMEFKNCFKQSLGVGHYSDFQGERLLFATDEEFYNNIDTPFSEKRHEAQLVFTKNGIITYYFPNQIALSTIVKEVSFSLELCSEASYYNNDYLSDITFWINKTEVATYLSLGDYGDRRGLLNPAWWTNRNTQYGKLVNITVNEQGVFLNEKKVSEKITLKTLNLDKGNKIEFSFGNKKGCKHPGGFNVFGKGFGDYPQDIVLKIYYE